MSDKTLLIQKLMLAQIGSCTCLTKTPEVSWHDATCRYRVLAEAADELRVVLAQEAGRSEVVAIDRVNVQMLKGGTFRWISEPDGDMVRYTDHCAQVERLKLEIDRLNRVKLALAEKSTNHADNCAVYRAQLASPPVPVAVVLPPYRVSIPAGLESHSDKQWNAALDMVKELNQ